MGHGSQTLQSYLHLIGYCPRALKRAKTAGEVLGTAVVSLTLLKAFQAKLGSSDVNTGDTWGNEFTSGSGPSWAELWNKTLVKENQYTNEGNLIIILGEGS